MLNTDHFDGIIHRFYGIIGRADGIMCQFRWNYSPELIKLSRKLSELSSILMVSYYIVIVLFDGIIDHIDAF